MSFESVSSDDVPAPDPGPRPLRHPRPRGPSRLTDRTAVLPDPTDRESHLLRLRNERRRDPDSRRAPRGEHERAPFGAVRAFMPTARQMNGGIRRFVAEDLLEERARGLVEEPRSEHDLPARGAVAPERPPQPGSRAEPDALGEVRDAPELRPGFDERMERFELTEIEVFHVRAE